MCREEFIFTLTTQKPLFTQQIKLEQLGATSISLFPTQRTQSKGVNSETKDFNFMIIWFNESKIVDKFWFNPFTPEMKNTRFLFSFSKCFNFSYLSLSNLHNKSSHHRLFTNTSTSWSSSSELCESQKGKLPVMRSREEMRIFMFMLKKSFVYCFVPALFIAMNFPVSDKIMGTMSSPGSIFNSSGVCASALCVHKLFVVLQSSFGASTSW